MIGLQVLNKLFAGLSFNLKVVNGLFIINQCNYC